MLKAYKLRIYPNQQQTTHLIRAMGSVRYLYNRALEVKVKHYAETGKTLSYFDLSAGLLKEEKTKHEWLRETYAQSLQESLRHLDNAFTRFFHHTAAFPTFKSRHDNHHSVSYTQGVRVDWKASKVWVPKCGLVSVVLSRRFEGKIKTCTVSRTPTHKFFISILVEDGKDLPVKPPMTPEMSSIGIDLGIKHLAITSNGQKFDNPKHLRASLMKLQKLQRRLSRKKKGSKNRKKAQLLVARAYETISNQRKDYLHKLTSSLIDGENQTIFIEDLSVANMVRNHKLALSIQDCGWGMFKQFLTYKAAWAGKNVIQIGRFQPSSKMCSHCGTVNQDLTLKDREWTCSSCQTTHDRDINAAQNIKQFGLIQLFRNTSGQELPKEPVSSARKRSRSRKGETEMPGKKSGSMKQETSLAK